MFWYRRLLLALGIVVVSLWLAPPAAAVSYIRDEIRVLMRTGPGTQYKIIETLKSGDEVTPIAGNEEWSQVRLATGKEGWVPANYVTPTAPASVVLPAAQAKLTQSTVRIEELEKKLATQAVAIRELDSLRESNKALDTQVNELTWSSGWKSMATGALIIVCGMVVGLLIPRGGAAARNRLKL